MAQLLEAPRTDVPVEIRRAPAPLHGGLPTLLRFMAQHRMLSFKYIRLIVRMLRRKLWLGRRLKLDGIAFIGPGVVLQVGKDAQLEIGRWTWIGHGTKIRCHEGIVSIGAKTVIQGAGLVDPSYQVVAILPYL